VKIATWNINSLKVRLVHLHDWLQTHPVDVICLQETKLTDENFPAAALAEAGYQTRFTGQKTYNGVALLVKNGLSIDDDLQLNLPNFEDPQRRLIAATVDGVRVICAYFPNGQAVASDKFQYKLKWIAALTEWLGQEIARYPRLALAGDYNIAPEARDVHDPALWEGQVLFSEAERGAFKNLLDLGLVDTFRLFDQPDRSYTWWDYRQLAFRRKMGLRIDHILATSSLAGTCTACTIDVEPRRREQPSDHAPVCADFALSPPGPAPGSCA
jgi:exodeoxyribonuclease III